ncbi:MAG: C4-dicarboxylate ABC transporter substrate-binding protein [Rhodobacteraceae bacterium]|nr:C4-dicarboxylate ABC transporter substrate-binding protein [Paracoccaceae bacterium]
MRTKTNRTLLAALAATTLATGAFAQERLTANGGFPASSILTKVDYTDFVKSVEVASNGDISFDLHVGGSLLPIATTLEGLSDGIADVGNVVAAYVPSSLPRNNVVADMGFVLSDHMAAAFAVTEMNITNDALQKEWGGYNVVYGGGFSTPAYYFLCNKPIRSFGDLKGTKIRTASGSHVEFVKSANGEPVSVPFTDVYTGLERGSLDCVMASLENLGTGFKLWDVIKHITMLPTGTHISGGAWVYNQATWERLSVEQRKTLFAQMALTSVRRQIAYNEEIDRSLEGSWERGVERIEPDASLSDAVAGFKESFVDTLPATSESKRKVPAEEAKALIDNFQSIYSRWQTLLDGVDRTDEAALAALVQSEIYNKLDAETYGL